LNEKKIPRKNKPIRIKWDKSEDITLAHCSVEVERVEDAYSKDLVQIDVIGIYIYIYIGIEIILSSEDCG